MNLSVEEFYESINDIQEKSKSLLIDLFAYYLTEIVGQDIVTASTINRCFSDCDLDRPSRTSSHLSEGLVSKPKKYVKVDTGYRLHRQYKKALESETQFNTLKTVSAGTLRGLESKILDKSSRDFLAEALNCYEIGANRATIVLVWILVIDHLYSHVLIHHLADFNLALQANKDKRVKVTQVTRREDFSDIPEGKFLELCRSAKIISNDVRKILDQKLGIRNTCAHASSVGIGEAKVIDFVEDLIANVVLKHSL